MDEKETQTSVASELTQTYILSLLKENPAVLVSSFLKESAYRWFIRLLSMGATAYQIKTTIDWCFQDLYWKSRLGDPGTLFHRWNDLSSKALASKKEQEARMPRNANMITPILLADYWAIENGEMSQKEAKALAPSAKYYLDFYGEGGSGQRWKAILALAEGKDPKPFIEAFKEEMEKNKKT